MLLCRSKGAKHFFLPGGHVEFGEKAVHALRREMQEELGASVRKITFLDAIENIFSDGEITHHELNLVFRATLAKTNVVSLEDHLEFFWGDIKILSSYCILPNTIKAKLLVWVKDNQ